MDLRKKMSRLKRIISRIIARLTGRSKSVRPGKVKCHVKGYDIILDIGSEIEIFRAETYSTKEPETLEWIERFFRPNDVIYDVGANIGLYSLFAAKRLEAKCKVYSFEPEALNYAQLNKNIYINGLSGIIIPCCLALTDRLCFDVFNLHPNIVNPEKLGKGLVAGSAAHNFGEAKDYAGDLFEPIHIQGMLGLSLDELWGSLGLDFPNHIKVDVDGLEASIIEGSKKTIQDKRLKSLMIEISVGRADENEITRKMVGAGFEKVTDFADHSKRQLIGTPYEGSENTLFVRSNSSH